MKKQIRKIIKTIVICFIIAMIYENILQYFQHTTTAYLVDKILVDTMILTFIALHFVIGISQLYDFIIRHRFKIAFALLLVLTLLQYSGSSNGIYAKLVMEPEKDNTVWGIIRGIHSDEYALETPIAISQRYNQYGYTNELLRGIATDVFSIIHVPVKDIVSIGKLFNIGYFIFNDHMALAFWWNLRWIALLLVSFEFCMLLTNQKKGISCCACIGIAYSGVCQWWFSNAVVDLLIFGQLMIVLCNQFLKEKSLLRKVLYTLGISISIISCIMTQYPAGIVSLGYMFLALAIWVICKNRKQYHFQIQDGLLICLGCGIVLLIGWRYFHLSYETIQTIRQTTYPGNRLENGGGGISYLFSYVYNFMLPYIETKNPLALASIISLFPIPMIMAIFYMYRKESHIAFLLPMSIVAVLETVFCMSGLPNFLSRITLLQWTTVERTAIAVGMINFYIWIYMLANIEENLVGIKSAIRISLITMCVVIFIALPEPISSKGYITLFASVLCMFIFLFLNNGDSRYRKVLLTFLVLFTLIGGILVNPITKGVYAITDTDLAKKIQSISQNDQDALWMSLDNMMILSNYAVANGAKTINATNTYPNANFFKTVLGNEKAEEQKEIWNRYSHIEVTLDVENYVEKIDKDKIQLHMTPQTLKMLNVKYIITYQSQAEIANQGLILQTIYEKKTEEKITFANKQINTIYIYEIVE